LDGGTYDIVDDPHDGIGLLRFIGWTVLIAAFEAWRDLFWKLSRGGMGK